MDSAQLSPALLFSCGLGLRSRTSHQRAGRPILTRGAKLASTSGSVWTPVQSGGLQSPALRSNCRDTLRVASSTDQEVSTGSFVDSMKAEKKLESTRIDSKTRESVISAIQSLRNRVTVGDVAGLVGVSLSKAEEVLKALAADSSGALEVSNDGELIYVFNSNFKNDILAKSFLLRWEPALKKFREVAGSVGRFAFGLGFVLTVITVWVGVAAMSSSGDRDDNRNQRSNGMFMAFDLLDAFRWWLYFSRPAPPRIAGKLGFMESVYSVVFGDGDPNADFDDLRWNMVGKYIQSKGGVVTAEELAPYLDPPSSDVMGEKYLSDSPDEKYMLPVLIRFEGSATVSDSGDLLYVFPKFQQSASKASIRRPLASYLQESSWKLTAASNGQKLMVGALAVLNIIGVNILRNAATTVPELAPYAPGLLVLQVYAWSFVVLPLTRYFVNNSRNQKIDARNKAREQASVRVKIPSVDLQQKIKEARLLGNRQVLSDKDVIYSSKNSTSKFEEQDFDRRLSEN